MSEIIAPPQNIEAERQVLEAILLDNKAIKKAGLEPEDFYKTMHGEIFKAMQDIDRDGNPIDGISLNTLVQDHAAYINELSSEAYTAANISYHGKIIKELSQKRKLMKACIAVYQGIGEMSLDDALSGLRREIHGLIGTGSGKIMSYKSLMKETLKHIEDRYNNRDKLSGIASGFIDIDELTDGWQNSDLIILAARPSVGKSALSQIFAENAGVPAGILQLEMGEIQTGIRSVARESNTALYKLRKGYLSRDDWGPVQDAVARLAEREIYVDFSTRKLTDIERTFTQLVELHKVKIVIVDYLQLADASSKKDQSRAQEVAEISKLLKSMAKTHKIPVIALSQLNRKVEDRAVKKPTLSDLKESGQIEQDADVVMFLYEDEKEKNVLVVYFAKGRNIGLSTVRLSFDKNMMTFRNYDKGEI